MKTIAINKVQIDKLYWAIEAKRNDLEELIESGEGLHGSELNDLQSWFAEVSDWINDLRQGEIKETPDAIGVGEITSTKQIG